MTDDEVRDMLRARADSVRPSPDGLERIEAKLDTPRRSRTPLLVAAAAVVAIAAIGVALVARDDDGTPVTSGPVTSSTSTTSTTAVPMTPLGAWPGPGDGDELDPSVFTDPVTTAKAYVDDRVGDVDVPDTQISDYQAGDANSGEVAFHGGIDTTVFVRQASGGRWFVVGSATDLLPVHDAGDGVLVMTADTAGDVRGAIRSATGAVAPVDAHLVTDPGTELWRGSSGGAWFTLDTRDGSIGLAEVRIEEPEPPAVAEAVLTATGVADPRDAVVAYLADRLDGRSVRVDDFTSTDDAHGEVTWEAGVVKVVKLADGWHVHEAIGDSIQIAGTSLDAGYIGGALTLAQSGTVHLTVGDVTWDVRNDVDREGTTVRFEHDVPTDEPVILRAVFETDTGYVSLAEKVVG